MAMARKGHISDAFWGEDFNSKAGYKAVNKRMLDGMETCKSLIFFIRQRIRTEDEYSKGLVRNVKGSDFNLEIGKLREALETFRLSSEKAAGEHQMASKELQDTADRLQRYVDKLKSEWTGEKDKVKKVIVEKQRLYDKAMVAKKTYHDKAKEAEQADVKRKFMVGQPPHAIERIVKAVERAKMEAEKADQLYREAIQALDETRDQWEKLLYRYYKFCEDRDKERIIILQNELWVVSNIGSVTYVNNDQLCEDVRLVLEKVVPEADITEFVEKNKTGTKKPAKVPFEPYQCHVIDTGAGHATLQHVQHALPSPKSHRPPAAVLGTVPDCTANGTRKH